MGSHVEWATNRMKDCDETNGGEPHKLLSLSELVQAWPITTCEASMAVCRQPRGAFLIDVGDCSSHAKHKSELQKTAMAISNSSVCASVRMGVAAGARLYSAPLCLP